MSCGFCADACCQHGVDVSIHERDRILVRAETIEMHTVLPREAWFEDAITEDADFPGGAATRTAVVDGRCVFLSRAGRGCTLHALSLAEEADYHLLKPMVSTLFPVTFGDGTLLCSDELTDGSLICAGEGPTAYEMARSELAWYFGHALVDELDSLHTGTATTG